MPAGDRRVLLATPRRSTLAALTAEIKHLFGDPLFDLSPVAVFERVAGWS